MAIPQNTVWYIEARPWVKPPEFAPAGASMGSAVAVRLELLQPGGEPYDPPRFRKFLLTCGHVVRTEAKQGMPKTGWGPLLAEILCFRPRFGFTRTHDEDRRSGVPRSGWLAEVHPVSPHGKVPDEVPETERLAFHDWVLLDVKKEAFQAVDAVELGAAGMAGSTVAIVGYPGGAGVPGGLRWNDGDPVDCAGPFNFILQGSTEPGTLNLSGSESRAGMSGGPIFSEPDGALLGLHRASSDPSLLRHAIVMEHIRNELKIRRFLLRMALPPAVPAPLPAAGPGGAAGAEVAPAPPPARSAPAQDLVVGTEPLIPFIHRPTLRAHLQKISSPNSRHKGISLTGAGTCGKSWSRHLIAHVARETGMDMAYISLAQGQSLGAACRRITRDLNLDVTDMGRRVLDDQATDETVGQKFAFWLTTALRGKSAWRAVLVVDDIVLTAGTRSPLYEELVLPLFHELKGSSDFSRLLIILIGGTFPPDKSMGPYVLNEPVEAFTGEQVADYLNEYAARRNRVLSHTEHLQLLLEITGGATGALDGAMMETVMLATQQILEKGVI